MIISPNESQYVSFSELKQKPVKKEPEVHIPWWQYDYTKTDQQKIKMDTKTTTEKYVMNELNSGTENVTKTSPNNSSRISKEEFIYQLTGELITVNNKTETMEIEKTEIVDDLPSEIIGKVEQDLAVTPVKLPNLLNPKVKISDNILSFGDVSTSEKRLELFSGMSGILSHMDKDDCKPDIKVVMQLLDMIPNTVEAENKLINVALDTYKVKLDTDFVNMLIRRRNLRKEHQLARVCNLFFYQCRSCLLIGNQK